MVKARRKKLQVPVSLKWLGLILLLVLISRNSYR